MTNDGVSPQGFRAARRKLIKSRLAFNENIHRNEIVIVLNSRRNKGDREFNIKYLHCNSGPEYLWSYISISNIFTPCTDVSVNVCLASHPHNNCVFLWLVHVCQRRRVGRRVREATTTTERHLNGGQRLPGGCFPSVKFCKREAASFCRRFVSI